jgi:hypothetical protein
MATITEENNKNIPDDISTSINILTEKQEENHNENNINNDEKLTVEDLTNIIYEPDEQPHQQIEKKEEIITKKENPNSSKDVILENETSNIRKPDLNKYLMVNKKFTPSSIESEEETIKKNRKSLNPTKCKLYKFVGRCLFLILDKYENPLIIIGPHWPMYVCFCSFISLIMFGVYLKLWDQIGLVMRILGYICYWTYFISYAHCSLYNPGYPKNDMGRNFGSPRQDYHYCEKCHFYLRKNKYASHCNDCDICIENYDHHCPWTGHCIGRNNLYSFYIFISSSFSMIIYFAVAISIGASKLE